MIRAAGAVAWRPGPDGGELEVLLVHRKKYDDWSLPKGKAEPGEPLPLTAVREVFEEGGARLVLGRRLTSVRYQAGGRPKRVHYWAARAGDVADDAVPNSEVDKVAWLPAGQAKEQVSYSHDRRVLDDFTGQPPDTVPLILVRHARAVPKPEWDGDDAERPLEDAGRASAKALAPLLASFAPAARVISSTAVRCLDTVRPFAELTGAQVRAEQSLHVQSPGTEPADSAATITGAIAAGGPAVCCAHRENLPVLQAAAIGALGPPLGARLPGDWGDPLPTPGFWVLHTTARPGGPQTPRWRRWLGASRPGGDAGPALVTADRYDLSEVLTDCSWGAGTAARRRRLRSRTRRYPVSSTTSAISA
jgi:8-oxo-dGTP pyrophosphatase MutT (NUDIX family)/phosphohistidine phosphatase SixA